MSITKLKAAKELIEEKKYDEARVLLRSISDDPVAKRWLRKLDEVAPARRLSTAKILAIAAGTLVLLLIFVAAVILGFQMRSNQSAAFVYVTATANPTENATTSGKWRFSEDTSLVDDSTTAILTLRAEEPVQGWLRQTTPILYLRCKTGYINEYEAYIHVGTQIENDSRERIRIDDGRVENIGMSESTNGESLFFPNAGAITERMLDHETMAFEFTPFNSGPTDTVFDIRGLREAYQALRVYCPGSVNLGG